MRILERDRERESEREKEKERCVYQKETERERDRDERTNKQGVKHILPILRVSYSHWVIKRDMGGDVALAPGSGDSYDPGNGLICLAVAGSWSEPSGNYILVDRRQLPCSSTLGNDKRHYSKPLW